MKGVGLSDFLVGIGMLFVIEGLLFAALPGWMREAIKKTLITPDHVLRVVGIASAVGGLALIWLVRR